MSVLYTNSKPLVSVILTTYNRGYILKKAIDSVLAQTFCEWELIVVDDGSEDNTYEVVSEFKEESRIVYHRHSNIGVAFTKNVGVMCSSGKYVTFLDSDDEYKPEHLKLRLDVLESDQKIDIIHGGFEVIGSPYVKDKNDRQKLIHLKNCFIGGTIFAKRDVFFEIGGFKKTGYSPESDMMERAKAKFKIKKVNFPTYIYNRESPDSICNNI